MAIFYHEATRSFFNSATHAVKSIPVEAVEISPTAHASLLAGEAAGKTIQLDEHGQVFLVEPAVDPNVPSSRERAWRDGEIESFKWLRERHRDELELSSETTLTGGQYGELLTYMQQLRDWPAATGFPDPAARPTRPAWIAEQTQ